MFVGTEEEVRREHRKVVEVQGREVVVFAIRDMRSTGSATVSKDLLQCS